MFLWVFLWGLRLTFGCGVGVFPDGDRFSTWLGAAADVAGVETFRQVGWAANAYRAMGVYKDRVRVLYEVGGWAVYTVYYCT